MYVQDKVQLQTHIVALLREEKKDPKKDRKESAEERNMIIDKGDSRVSELESKLDLTEIRLKE